MRLMVAAWLWLFPYSCLYATDHLCGLELENEILARVRDEFITAKDIEWRMPPRILDVRRRLQVAELWNEETQDVFLDMYVPEFRKAFCFELLDRLRIIEAKQYWQDEDEEACRLLALWHRLNPTNTRVLCARRLRRQRLLAYADGHAPADWNACDSGKRLAVRRRWIQAFIERLPPRSLLANGEMPKEFLSETFPKVVSEVTP
ncbi:MAG: hypothetical protein KIS92_13540 [Planctomycetota bacterium]|nr:hypothetical protein [Planctomycetota bacterium]